MPTLSWMVGDLGGGVTIHTASVTSVAPGACDHVGFSLFTVWGAFIHGVVTGDACSHLSCSSLCIPYPYVYPILVTQLP